MIFRKLWLLFAAAMLAVSLSACAGMQDWEFSGLPGNYEVWRINSQTISLVSRKSEHTADTVVASYVFQIAWNDDFILAKQKPTKDKPDSEARFYIVETADKTVTGPLEEAEFQDMLEEREIPLDDADWVDVLDLDHSHW